MLQIFVIVLREGFESFLLVAIILAYLRKTKQASLTPAVYSAIVASVIASAALGYVLMQGANQSLWEGVLGLVAVVMVASLLVHMWKAAPRLKQEMYQRLDEVSTHPSRKAAFWGVFLFTLLMITREGMETTVMLLQVHGGQYVAGIVLGVAAATTMAWLWARFGHRVNLKRFFQVTAIFLLLFLIQVAIYSVHELCEAGIFSNSGALHDATEVFSPNGLYGKWFSVVMLTVCTLWLIGAWLRDRLQKPNTSPALEKDRPHLVEKA
jgi:high-affinity iron transporter